MTMFMEKVRDFFALRRDNERGASAVEYGLLIAGIAAVIVVAVMALGPVVKGAFDNTKDNICTGSTATSNDGCKTTTTGG